jgi:hypothetical protein
VQHLQHLQQLQRVAVLRSAQKCNTPQHHPRGVLPCCTVRGFFGPFLEIFTESGNPTANDYRHGSEGW